MASGYNNSAGQAALDRFTEMMIGRMEQMKASDWKKGWIGRASGYAGLPQNVGRRNYSARTRCSCSSTRRRKATGFPFT